MNLQRIFFLILFISNFLASCATISTPIPDPQAFSEDYLQQWAEATSALMDFSLLELREATLASSSSNHVQPFKDERNRFDAARASLLKMHPSPKMVSFHWKFMSLYEEILSDMDMINDAIALGDKSRIDQGWTQLRYRTKQVQGLMGK